MIKNISKLLNISSKLNKFLDLNKNLCNRRIRKNDIYDALLYKLYYTKYSTTQEKAVIKLNQFKKDKSSRQSIVKKENQLSDTFYNNLSTLLGNEIKKNTHSCLSA